MEVFVRMAFMSIDPEAFPPPSWMPSQNELEPRDLDHAEPAADLHREATQGLPSFQEKAAYAVGVLDAQAVMDAEKTAHKNGWRDVTQGTCLR